MTPRPSRRHTDPRPGTLTAAATILVAIWVLVWVADAMLTR